MGNYENGLYGEPEYTNGFVTEVRTAIAKVQDRFKGMVNPQLLYEICWQINLGLMEIKKTYTRFHYNVYAIPSHCWVAVVLYDPYNVIPMDASTIYVRFQRASYMPNQMGFCAVPQAPLVSAASQQTVQSMTQQDKDFFKALSSAPPTTSFGSIPVVGGDPLGGPRFSKPNQRAIESRIEWIISDVDPVMLECIGLTKEQYADQLKSVCMNGPINPDDEYDMFLERFRLPSVWPQETYNPLDAPAMMYPYMERRFKWRDDLRRAGNAADIYIGKIGVDTAQQVAAKHHVPFKWLRLYLKISLANCKGYPSTHFKPLMAMEPSTATYKGPWEFLICTGTRVRQYWITHKPTEEERNEPPEDEEPYDVPGDEYKIEDEDESKEDSSTHPKEVQIEERGEVTRDKLVDLIFTTLSKSDPYLFYEFGKPFEQFVKECIDVWNEKRFRPNDWYNTVFILPLERCYPLDKSRRNSTDAFFPDFSDEAKRYIGTDTGFPKINGWIKNARSVLLKVENHIASMNKSYLESILKEYHCSMRNLREWFMVNVNTLGGEPAEYITGLIRREPYDPGKGGFTDPMFVGIMLSQPERKTEISIPKHPCSDPNQDLKPVDPNACATQTFVDLTKDALKDGTAKVEEPEVKPKEEPKEEPKDDKFGLTPADLHEIHGQFIEPTVHTRPLMVTKEQKDNAIKEMDKILQANNLRSFSGLRLLLAMRSLKDLGINKVTANFIYSVTNNTSGATLVKYIDKGWVRKMDKYPFGPGNTYWYTLTAEGLNVIDKIDQYPVDWKLAYKNTTFNLSETMRRRVEAVMTATDETECDASLEIYKHDLCKHRLMLSGLFRKDGNVLILTDTGRIFRKHLQEQRLAEGIENDPTI